MRKVGRSPSSPSPSPAPSTPSELSSLIDLQGGPRKAASRAGALLIDEAIDSFLLAQGRKGRAAGTLVTSRRHLLHFSRFLEERGVVELCRVTPEDVFAFWDHELSREREHRGGPLSAGTLLLAVNALRTFFSHLVAEGTLLIDPSRELKGPRGKKKLPHEIPTARQMRQLVLSPPSSTPLGKRNRAILELMYGTGLRASELCGLSLSDVDVSRRQVFVAKGKGGKQRLVPMGRKAAQAVAQYLLVRETLGGATSNRGVEPAVRASRDFEPVVRASDGIVPAIRANSVLDALFVRRGGGGLRTPALRYILARSRTAARLTVHPTPHTLRHACATHLLKGGAGIRQIQVLLGHASLESTEIYTKVETSDLKAMLDRHHPRSQS